MKQILVPIDFSEASRNAAKYATSFAKVFHADVLLLNVVSPPIIADDSFLAPVMVTQAEKVNESKRLMEGQVNFLAKQYPSRVSGSVTEGLPEDAVIEIAKNCATDLIIAGMKGKGKSNSIFGSVATAIIRKRQLPVLLVPERATFQPMKYITLASDFAANMEVNRYQLLWEIAEQFSSEIDILNIEKSEGVMTQDAIIGKMRTSRAFLKFNHQFYALKVKNITKEILSFIKDHPTDLLVMVEHSHTMLERIFSRDHTQEMSYETEVPLLVVPEQSANLER